MTRDRTRPIMLAVAAIILLVVGIAWSEVYRLIQESNRQSARLEISRLTEAIDNYARRQSRLPGSLEELGPGELLGLRSDPWGTPFLYRRSSETFEVRSAGPDRVPGTSDDVTVESGR